jgi:hypothetical protein
MSKPLVALNVLALSTALGLFVWANTRPEMLIVEYFDGQSYKVTRNGPGWPVPAWRTRSEGFHVNRCPPKQSWTTPSRIVGPVRVWSPGYSTALWGCCLPSPSPSISEHCSDRRTMRMMAMLNLGGGRYRFRRPIEPDRTEPVVAERHLEEATATSTSPTSRSPAWASRVWG